MQKTKLAVLLSTTLIAGVAQAQSGIYVGLEGGIASQSGLPSQAEAGATSVDNSLSPNAIRASLGYNHDLNSLLGIGLEIGAGKYGKTTYHYADGTTTDISSGTVEFLATSMLHINPKFDLIAKVGGIRITPDVTGTNAGEKSTQIAPQASIGAAYNFNSHLAATLSYAHVFGTSVTNVNEVSKKATTLDEALLGLRYSFGS